MLIRHTAAALLDFSGSVECVRSKAEVVVVVLHAAERGSGAELLQLLKDVGQPKVVIVLWCWVDSPTSAGDQHTTLKQVSYDLKGCVVLSYRIPQLYVKTVMKTVLAAAIEYVKFDQAVRWAALTELCGPFPDRCRFWHCGSGPFTVMQDGVSMKKCIDCGGVLRDHGRDKMRHARVKLKCDVCNLWVLCLTSGGALACGPDGCLQPQ